MHQDGYGWLIFFAFCGAVYVGVAIYGWFAGKSHGLREDEYNRQLKQKLQQEQQRLREEKDRLNKQLDEREALITSIYEAFEEGYIKGRRWLADFIAEVEHHFDLRTARILETKKRPAKKAAENVRQISAEKRKLLAENKFLEYQLRTYEEYWPELAESVFQILNDEIERSDDFEGSGIEHVDPVLKFISANEYNQLSSAERSQLALDKYLSRHHTKQHIGRMYERYLGYLMEEGGWQVEYHGIKKGLEDFGRDLICSNGVSVRIIQAKNWSSRKTIYEKHILQLYGTVVAYRLDHALPSERAEACFVTSTHLSDHAKDFAVMLGIEVFENFALDKSYPMIKCNVSRNGEKIYHLPFDQQYDHVIVEPHKGETYVASAAEAEALGFRRAYRYTGLRRNG